MVNRGRRYQARQRERHVKPREGLGIRKMFNSGESVVEYEVTAEVWGQRVGEKVMSSGVCGGGCTHRLVERLWL